MTQTLNDYGTAQKLRDIITRIVNNELTSARPDYRYATVQAIDRPNRKVFVIYPGETDVIPINMGSIEPSSVGQTVRIAGRSGDRYLEDVIGTPYVLAPGTDPSYVSTTTYTATGDLLVGTGASSYARLAVGGNGTVLTADSSQPGGMKWAAPTITGLTAGTGISVGTGTTPTVTNTGVLSVSASGNLSSTGGQNPALSITATPTFTSTSLSGGSSAGVIFPSGGTSVKITEAFGLTLGGDSVHPVQVSGTALLVGQAAASGGTYTAGTLYSTALAIGSGLSTFAAGATIGTSLTVGTTLGVTGAATFSSTLSAGAGTFTSLYSTSATAGIVLVGGNTSGAYTSNQITLGYGGALQYQHAIKTRHNASAAAGNAIDFFLWNQGTDAIGTIGTFNAMSIEKSGISTQLGITTPTLSVSGVITHNAENSNISTANTGSTAIGYWSRIASVNITFGFGEHTSQILMIEFADGNTNQSTARVNFRVKQQSGFGSDPIVNVTILDITGTPVIGDFVAVIKQNTPTTIVELWFRTTQGFQQYSVFPQQSAGVAATWFNNDTLVSALPSGTQKAATYTSGYFTGITADSLVLQPRTPGIAQIGLYDTTASQTTPNKFLRSSSGQFQVVNSAYSSVIFSIADTGATVVGGLLSANAGLTVSGTTNLQSTYLGDQPLYFRSPGDANHYMKYNTTPNGPDIAGYSGGRLGYMSSGSFLPMLNWSSGLVESLGSIRVSTTSSVLVFQFDPNTVNPDGFSGKMTAPQGSINAAALQDGTIPFSKLSGPASASVIAFSTQDTSFEMLRRVSATGTSLDANGKETDGLSISNGATRVADGQAYGGYAISNTGMTSVGVFCTSGPGYTGLAPGQYQAVVFVKVSSTTPTTQALSLQINNGSTGITGNPAVSCIPSQLSTSYIGVTVPFTITAAGTAINLQVGNNVLPGTLTWYISHIKITPSDGLQTTATSPYFFGAASILAAQIQSLTANQISAGVISTDDIQIGAGGRLYIGTSKTATTRQEWTATGFQSLVAGVQTVSLPASGAFVLRTGTTGTRINLDSTLGLELWNGATRTFFADVTTGNLSLIGSLTGASSIQIGTTGFGVDTSGNLFMGAASYAAATNFKVSNTGLVTAQSASISGAITATSGQIAGFSILGNQLYSGSTTTRVMLDSATGITVGSNTNDATAPFHVDLNGTFTARAATIIGSVTATSGTIGTAAAGWTISSTAITSRGAGTSSLVLDATNNRIVVGTYQAASSIQLEGANGIYLGGTPGSGGTAPFRVDMAGNLIATSATITGALNVSQSSSFAANVFVNSGGNIVVNGGLIKANSGGGLSNVILSGTGLQAFENSSTTNQLLGPLGVFGGAGETLRIDTLGYIYASKMWISGTLTVAAATTLNGTLSLGTGQINSTNFNVTSSGILSATSAVLSSVTIQNTSTLNGAVSVGASLNVTGSLTLNGGTFATSPTANTQRIQITSGNTISFRSGNDTYETTSTAFPSNIKILGDVAGGSVSPNLSISSGSYGATGHDSSIKMYGDYYNGTSYLPNSGSVTISSNGTATLAGPNGAVTVGVNTIQLTAATGIIDLTGTDVTIKGVSAPRGWVAGGRNAATTTLSTTAGTETTVLTANAFTFVAGRRYRISATARGNAGVAGALIAIRVRTVAAGTQLANAQTYYTVAGGPGQQDQVIFDYTTSLTGSLSLVLAATTTSSASPASSILSAAMSIEDIGT